MDEAYHILLDSVNEAIADLDRNRWSHARKILADAKYEAEYCFVKKDAPTTSCDELLVPIKALGLPVHEYHILDRAGLRNLSDVVELGPKRLRSQRNCGAKSYCIILDKLEESGYELTDEWWEWIDHKPMREI